MSKKTISEEVEEYFQGKKVLHEFKKDEILDLINRVVEYYVLKHYNIHDTKVTEFMLPLKYNDFLKIGTEQSIIYGGDFKDGYPNIVILSGKEISELDPEFDKDLINLNNIREYLNVLKFVNFVKQLITKEINKSLKKGKTKDLSIS